MDKPRVAFFSFSSCEGCQLEVLNLEDRLLNLVNVVDIVNFREAMSERSTNYDVAFVEGSITSPAEIPQLNKIRQQAKVLVTMGACAHLGGINCLKNHFRVEISQKLVYGDKWHYFPSTVAQPLEVVVKVDYFIPGCPVDKEEFLRVVKGILWGQKPFIPDYPVCVECKLRGNVCIFFKGMPCAGPVIRAGCNARCPSYGNSCIGCRGLVSEPNITSWREMMGERGFSNKQADDLLEMFNSYWEVLAGE